MDQPRRITIVGGGTAVDDRGAVVIGFTLATGE